MEGSPATSSPASARLLLLLVVLTGLVHLPALRTGYAYDDVEAILENEDLRHWSCAPKLLLTNYWGERNIGLYRPMVQWSYLVDGAGFGFDETASHLINLLLHLGVVALAYLLLGRLAFSPAAAFTTALLYGVNPAILQGAVWISGRTDVLATLFVLAGLLLACRLADERKEGWRFSAFAPGCLLVGLLWLLGLLSKEMAVTLPLLVLLLPGGRFLKRTVPVFVAAFGVYLALRLGAVDGFLPSHAGDGEGVVLRDHGIFDRVAIGYRACFRLLAQVVVPIGLCADHRVHPWALPTAPDDASAYGALFLGAILFYAGLRLRRVDRPLAFLVGAIPVVFLPLSQAIPIGAVMAERFNYLPAFFLLGALARALVLVGRRYPRASWLLPLLAALGLSLSVVITLRRIPVYETRGTFCEDVVALYPDDHKAWNNLGVYLFLERDPPDFVAADEALTRALEIEPSYRRGRLNLARCRMERARIAERAPDVSAVDEILGRWLERGHPDALYEAGRARLRAAPFRTGARARLLDEAHDLFKRCAERREAPLREAEGRGIELSRSLWRPVASAWKQAGLAARRAGVERLAVAAWTRALELDPEIDSAAAMRRWLDEAAKR